MGEQQQRPAQPAVRQAGALERIAAAVETAAAVKPRAIGPDPRPVHRLMALRLLAPSLVFQGAKDVPAEYWSAAEDGDGIVLADCPCGVEHRFGAGDVVECVTGRVFVFTGRRLLVAVVELEEEDEAA